MQPYRKLETDVLIIGSEAGGAMAAFHAARSGLSVTMVTKNTMGRGGVTILAPYSCNAALGLADPRDNPEVHYRDTVTAGRYINDRRLAWIMAEESPARVLELASWGLRWSTEGGKIRQGWMPGHSYPRALHVGLSTGLRMVQVFRAQARKYANIKVINDIFITRLMTDESGEVTGALGVDLDSGEGIVFVAKATIIATGGGMYLYRYNSAAPESTGDGYVYAYQVGARLIDMEFVQFFPTAGLHPRSLQGKMGPCVQRYYLNAYLYNAEGERFMSRYDPVNMEKASRDILARAIFMEIKAGRASPHGGVWLDCSYLPRNIIEGQLKKFFGGSWRWIGIDMLEYGLDVREKAVETIPVAHYFMGGVKVDETCSTGIPGLYVAGEAVGGIDGANRIAGNALSECLVTGARAGQHAARFAEARPMPSVSESHVKEELGRVFGLLERKGEESPVAMRKRLQHEMWENVGIIRNEGGLKKALETIVELKGQRMGIRGKARRYNREWQEALAMANMLEVAEIITRAALFRTESRGAHYREDYPDQKDEEWLANVVIVKDGEMVTSKAVVREVD